MKKQIDPTVFELLLTQQSLFKVKALTMQKEIRTNKEKESKLQKQNLIQSFLPSLSMVTLSCCSNYMYS